MTKMISKKMTKSISTAAVNRLLEKLPTMKGSFVVGERTKDGETKK